MSARRRRGRLTTLLLATALATAAGGDLAHAKTPPPLGTDGHGAKIVKRGRPPHLVVVLSPKRYRAVAGRVLQVACAHVPHQTLGGGTGDRGPRLSLVSRPARRGQVWLHPPRTRTPLATRLSPGWDWCVLTMWKAPRREVADWRFATVPLTPAGAAFADERDVAVRVIGSELFLFARPMRDRRLARLMHATLLPSPTQEPPPGRLGLYSDGHRHVYAAQRDHAGDLLFYEQDGDVTRTNLLRYLQNDSLLWGADPRP